MTLMTLGKASEIAQYPPKHLIDERLLIRKELDMPDMISSADGGPRLTLNVDDAAVLCGYADLRRSGYPVKLAGTIMSRIRTAMQANPRADALLTITLDNGFSFTVASDTIDLSSGFTSGGFVTTAFLFDVRNYRERVRRAIEAHEPRIEVENVPA